MRAIGIVFRKELYRVFSDKKMLRTFPNLKLKAQDGELIYMSSIYTDIQPYYYKFNF